MGHYSFILNGKKLNTCTCWLFFAILSEQQCAIVTTKRQKSHGRDCYENTSRGWERCLSTPQGHIGITRHTCVATVTTTPGLREKQIYAMFYTKWDVRDVEKLSFRTFKSITERSQVSVQTSHA